MLRSSRTEPGVLRVVGRGTQLEFTLDDRVPPAELESGLRRYLAQTAARFEGGKVSLNLGARTPDRPLLRRLRRVLREFHLAAVGFSCGADALDGALRGVETVASAPAGEAARGASREQWASERETLLVRGTCRSGMTVHNEGNVVVLGDVNPGAEVRASGDVAVFGRLGGLAHAGADGAEDPVVVAFVMEPQQLRLGAHIATDARTSGSAAVKGPAIALLRAGRIIVEPYTPRAVARQEG